MKVFISWSGSASHDAALALRDWISNVIQAVHPYVSSEDIGKGTRWFAELGRQLETTNFGILCVTPENRSAPWVLFEAGALSKSIDESNVTPLLIGLTIDDLRPPLAGFNATLTNKKDMKRLIETINDKLGDQKLDHRVLDNAFDKWWPDLSNALDAAVEKVRSPKKCKYDVFLSAPMAAFDSDDDYKKSRSEVKKVFDALEQHCGFNVFWAAEDIRSISDFDTMDTSVIVDLKAIKDSRYFVLLYPEKLVTSALFEAGYAIARKKFSLYFVTNQQDLPFLMRDAADVMSRVRLHTPPEWQTYDDIAALIEKHKTNLFLPSTNDI